MRLEREREREYVGEGLEYGRSHAGRGGSTKRCDQKRATAQRSEQTAIKMRNAPATTITTTVTTTAAITTAITIKIHNTVGPYVRAYTNYSPVAGSIGLIQCGPGYDDIWQVVWTAIGLLSEILVAPNLGPRYLTRSGFLACLIRTWQSRSGCKR